MQLSVILCTHNPRADYLQRVLDALKAQTLSKEQWELLLIDNASKESLATSWDLSWHPHARHIREEELGLTPARLRGIKESTGEILVFADDDNVLDIRYLQYVMEISKNYPYLGAWGGSCLPEFESPVDSDLKDFLPYLALREIIRPQWSNYDTGSVPIGAGLCVRSVIAQKYLAVAKNDPMRMGLGRRGTSLMGGEDFDLALTAYASGLGTGVFPQLQLRHLIPKKRLDAAYLYNICVQGALSYHLVRFLHFGEIPSRPSIPRRAIQFARQFFSHKKNHYSQALQEGQDRAILAIKNLPKSRTKLS
jgi:glycosyltransferase involved in cell wall biosynthesis